MSTETTSLQAKTNFSKENTAVEKVNKIVKVTLQKETPCGIFLPDWNSVVDAITYVASNDLRKTPISRDNIAEEWERLKDNDYHPQEYSYAEISLFRLMSSIPRTDDGYLKEMLEEMESTASLGSYRDKLEETRDKERGKNLLGLAVSIEKVKGGFSLSLNSEYWGDHLEDRVAESQGRRKVMSPKVVLVEFDNNTRKFSIDLKKIKESVYPLLDFPQQPQRRDLTVENILTTENMVLDLDHIRPERKDYPEYLITAFDGIEVVATLSGISNICYVENSKYGEEKIVGESACDPMTGEYIPLGLAFAIRDDRRMNAPKVITPENYAKADRLARRIKDVLSPSK